MITLVQRKEQKNINFVANLWYVRLKNVRNGNEYEKTGDAHSLYSMQIEHNWTF